MSYYCLVVRRRSRKDRSLNVVIDSFEECYILSEFSERRQLQMRAARPTAMARLPAPGFSIAYILLSNPVQRFGSPGPPQDPKTKHLLAILWPSPQ